jgi:hypothetical protein
VPRTFTLTETGSLGGLFHNHDWVHASNVENAFKPPEIVICELHNKLSFDYGCREFFESLDPSIMYKRKFAGIAIAYKKDIEILNQTVGKCIKRHVGKSAAGK